MSWSKILNHENVLSRFRQSAQRNRIASTYLFVGPPGVGKRTFAMKLAEALLCEVNPEADVDPCGNCPACQQVRAGTHPDLILVAKPKGKNSIPVETFIGDREHRRRVGLCHDIGLKPFRGGRKIAIIDDADFLNQESANSLLKTLEEPPPKSVLILIGTSEQKQLSTIVSRSQVIRFGSLTADQVTTLLKNDATFESDVPIAELAATCEGSIDLAINLADRDTLEFRQLLFSQMTTLDPGQENFAKAITSFVDAAGKDASAKRLRVILAGDFSISFFRQWMQTLCGSESSDPHFVSPAPFSDNPNLGCQVASMCIQRTMDLQRQISANVNNANAIAAWLTDLGRICREQYVESVQSL